MVQYFGLPNPTEREYEEIFGWYHADGDTRYWAYNPQTTAFHIVSTDGQWIRPELAGEWGEADLEEIRQKMDSLQFLPRPPLPDDPTIAVRGEPFAYEGWLFAWFFVPELRRWELGTIERRWQADPLPLPTKDREEALRSEREERRDRTLSLATKTIDAGVQLFDRYCRAMLLLGSWNAPEPPDGFRLIAGAALEASARFSEPTDVVRLVSKATGCEESVVQYVIDYLDVMGLYPAEWFRSADCNVVVTGLPYPF